MKKIKLLALLLFGALIVTACSEKPTEEATKVADEATETVEGEPTIDNPIVIDEAGKEIKVYAEVNDRFKEESTMHAIVAKTGKNKDITMFVSYSNHDDLYSALVDLGAKAGDNVTMDNMGEEIVEGDKINISFKFEDSNEELDINDVINDSSGREFDIRFGGNQEAAKDHNTGCMTCLQSCPLGITSSASQLIGADENDGVEYTLTDLVPDDGAPVIITYSLAD